MLFLLWQETVKGDTDYKLAVCGEERYGNDIISEIDLRTKVPHTVIVTPIEEMVVTYECKCIIDGCFHFKVDFIDTEETYSNFKAYLIDEEGNTVEYYFLDGFNIEQKIDVSQVEFSGDKNNIKFVITCECNGETCTIIETIVSI